MHNVWLILAVIGVISVKATICIVALLAGTKSSFTK